MTKKQDKMMICKCGHTLSLEVKTFCCDLRCPNYRPEDIGDCLNLIPYVEPQPATCPDCGHPSHDGKFCPVKIDVMQYCDCDKRTPADQPEKHCTNPLISRKDSPYTCEGYCQTCDYWKAEQPMPTMPLRGKLVSITYCGDCPHNDMCVSGKASYPYCNAPTPNRKFIENGVDARAGGIPSWCPLSDAEAHDSEVASKAVKEFAEKVIVRISGYKCDHSKLTESQQTVNWWLDRAIESIREMAEKE